MDPIALSSTLSNNFANQGLLLQLILDNVNHEYLLFLVMSHDLDFVKTTAEGYSYLVTEAVRKLDDMSVEHYLALIKNHYGDGVMEDLLTALGDDLQFTKKFVLNEHHLYGSSRLGVKTQKRLLLRKEFSISGFEQDGTYIVDEVKDSLVYVQSEVYFCRMLGQKQYELINHLGNVLATVLDRKTGIFDPTEDTLMYYEADVVNAKIYYPFGLDMMSYSNVDFNYSYDFNGKETDSETGLQDYGMRIYNKAYGRFLSVDPLFRSYPWYTPYQFAGNKPIIAVDLDGLEEFVIIRWYDNGKFMGTTVTYLKNEGDVRLHNNKKVMIINQVYSTENQELIRGGGIYKITNTGKITDLNDKAKNLIYGTHNQKFSDNFKNKTEYQAGIASFEFHNENPTVLKSPSVLLYNKPRKINFGFNDADPLKIDDGVIKQYKDFLKINPDYVIEITGFTDAKGTDDYNYKLGLKRAQEAKDYFISQGINPDRIVIKSEGESQAEVSEIATNEEREKDRRIEIQWKPAANN